MCFFILYNFSIFGLHCFKSSENFFPPHSILFTYCYYFLCYIIVVFALSLLSIWIIFHFYYFIVECITTPKIKKKKKNSLPPPIWRKNRQLWTLCKTTGYGNWTYTKWIAILGFLNIEMEFLKKMSSYCQKNIPKQLLLLLHTV